MDNPDANPHPPADDLNCDTDRVRTTPLIGEKVWFGPRRFGWGLSPVSVEGWMATGVALGSGIWLARRLPDRPWIRRVPGLGLLVIALIKGTAPGGPRARAALAEAAGPGAPDA